MSERGVVHFKGLADELKVQHVPEALAGYAPLLSGKFDTLSLQRPNERRMREVGADIEDLLAEVAMFVMAVSMKTWSSETDMPSRWRCENRHFSETAVPMLLAKAGKGAGRISGLRLEPLAPEELPMVAGKTLMRNAQDTRRAATYGETLPKGQAYLLASANLLPHSDSRPRFTASLMVVNAQKRPAGELPAACGPRYGRAVCVPRDIAQLMPILEAGQTVKPASDPEQHAVAHFRPKARSKFVF